ncbi:MAG TPA: peptidyl-dipeptidase Dcp [Puia sp.]|nr:peptidyl-dipeptidase Dcp [Puia sp.]
MKLLNSLPPFAVMVILASCNNPSSGPAKNDSLSSANPFYSVSSLSYHAPAFDKIKNSDFEPALEAGMKQKLSEMKQIENNPDSPTFENTLVAMEKAGQLLQRTELVFNLLKQANTNDELKKLNESMAPELSANDDAVYLNSRFFKKISSLYKRREQLNLDTESKRLLEYYFLKFEMAGANLADGDKEQLKKLNQRDASLSARFSNLLLGSTKAGALVLDSVSELRGLPQGTIDAAAQEAKADNLDGRWVIALQNTTQQPDLQFLSNRSIRQKLFEASWNRAEKKDSNDTRELISQLAHIRAQKAKLLGYPNFAAWNLQDQMAKTPDAVNSFLGKLIPSATASARMEASDIQSLINRQKGGFKLQPWDWEFYAEQVRKAKYDLDESQVKPYFELDTVLQRGVFYAANLLYGISFRERKDLPVYQPDVKVFEVMDQDGQPLALFYCDYFKRDNKNGGAWMDNLVIQSKLLGNKPIIYNICNFTKPAPGQPALISFSDVTTMFHEFGHALHGMFASQQYPSISGANTARDFVEFPSQFNEHWASDPKVFSHYAVHYQTGAAMPAALVDKIRKSATFNQGYMMTELLAAASLDMKWHELSADAPLQDADSFEVSALHKAHLDLPQVPSRYRSSYFSHIWSLGYAAGYYAYLWTEMLDDDAFSWFQEHGGLTRENGQRFRDMILSRGNTVDLAKMFRDFRGRDPEIGPMLENRGLKSK